MKTYVGLILFTKYGLTWGHFFFINLRTLTFYEGFIYEFIAVSNILGIKIFI